MFQGINKGFPGAIAQELSMRGMPKYLEGRELQVKSRIQVRWIWMALGVLKKKICDFLELMEVLEVALKSSRILRIILASLASRISHHHGIIHKLTLKRRLDARQGETLESVIFNGGFDVASEAFSHDNKKEGRERIPLSNASGGGEIFWKGIH
jgi:hypothetical protein